jgi:uncharacterized damage-inducible protein DinB
MKTHEAISSNLHTSRFIMTSYLSDLSDEDLIVRPVSAAHHAAWQIGHLILSESQMINGVRASSAPALPSEFAARHDKGAAKAGDNTQYYSKSQYLSFMNSLREATLALLSQLSEQDLSKPGPEAMRSYAPKVGSVFLSIANHELMHSGQIAVIRRALGKPVVI